MTALPVFPGGLSPFLSAHDLRQRPVHDHRMIENALQIGGVPKTRLQLRAIGNRTSETLIVRLYSSGIYVTPYRRFDVIADGTAQT